MLRFQVLLRAFFLILAVVMFPTTTRVCKRYVCALGSVQPCFLPRSFPLWAAVAREGVIWGACSWLCAFA